MKRKYLYRFTNNMKVKKCIEKMYEDSQCSPFESFRKTEKVFLNEAQCTHFKNLDSLKTKAYIKIADMIYFKKPTTKEVVLKLNQLNKIFRYSKKYLYHDFLLEFLFISRYNPAIKNNEIYKYKKPLLYLTYIKKYKNIYQVIDHILNCIESKTIEVGSREAFYKYMIFNDKDLDYTSPLIGAGSMFLKDQEPCLF